MTDPSPVDGAQALIAAVENPGRRADAQRLLTLMSQATGEPPHVRGGIIGFGHHHYRYETGREGDTVAVGFAPRASAIAVYVVGYLDGYEYLLDRLGPHRRGKGSR
jgi:hypothetical protein